MCNKEIKILNGNEGYKIVDTSGYDYEHAGSVEILGCIYGIDELKLIEILENNGGDVAYYNYKKNTKVNKDEYLIRSNENNSNVTPIVTFSTYEKASNILSLLNNME